MEITATVSVDLSSLKKFGVSIDAQLHHREQGHITKAFKQWAARYRSFVQERYDRFSKGGGNWAPLSWRTLLARRKGKGRKKFNLVKARRDKATGAKRGQLERFAASMIKASILRDLGILYTVLSPTFKSSPGAIEDNIPFGVSVGYGGPHKHAGGGKATIADIAMFHQIGAGNLPVRQIIVPPAISVLSQMTGDMDRAIKKMENE